MDKDAHSIAAQHESSHGTHLSYVIGFILSLMLTIGSYLIVVEHLIPERSTLVYTVAGFALLQAFIQLLFFLHLGSEPKPRRNFLTFLFMFSVLVIVVLGSLWIMHNLETHMMTQAEVDAYLLKQHEVLQLKKVSD